MIIFNKKCSPHSWNPEPRYQQYQLFKQSKYHGMNKSQERLSQGKTKELVLLFQYIWRGLFIWAKMGEYDSCTLTHLWCMTNTNKILFAAKIAEISEILHTIIDHWFAERFPLQPTGNAGQFIRKCGCRQYKSFRDLLVWIWQTINLNRQDTVPRCWMEV